MLMPTRPIVEVLDIVADVVGGLLARVVNALLDALLLQAREQGLCHGVAPAVSSPAHAGPQAIAALGAQIVLVHQSSIAMLAASPPWPKVSTKSWELLLAVRAGHLAPTTICDLRKDWCGLTSRLGTAHLQ